MQNELLVYPKGQGFGKRLLGEIRFEFGIILLPTVEWSNQLDFDNEDNRLFDLLESSSAYLHAQKV